MSLPREHGISRLALLCLPALALVAVAIVIALGHFSHSASAVIPNPGVHFAIAVDTNGDGTNDCTAPGGPTNCPAITQDAQFTVKYFLNANAGVAYFGIDTRTNYTGVASQDNAVMTPGFWPGCAIPASFYQQGEFARFGCAQGIGVTTGSTYTGPIGTLGFLCTASGTISLVYGANDTSISDDLGDPHAPGEGTMDTLNITCGAGPPQPTNTVAPTNTSGPPAPTNTTGPSPTATNTSPPTATRTPTNTPPPTATRTPTPPSVRGDANGDHEVTSQDALITLQYEAHLRTSLPNMQGADANGDGMINSIDALFMLWKEAGEPV